MTVAEAIESFLFHCQYEKNLSPKTLKAYGTDLRQFVEMTISNPQHTPVSSISRVILREYVRLLFETLSEKSVKRKIATVKCLFHFLEREDSIPANPFHKMDIRIRQRQNLPRTVSLLTIRSIFDHLYGQKRSSGEASREVQARIVRDIALMELLFATGARVAEVCSLRCCDVDLIQGDIRILGKGSRERLIHVCDSEALAALRTYDALAPTRTSREQPFFQTRKGGRLSEQSVRMSLHKAARAAGTDIRVTPHMIRHSVATLLLGEGVDIRYIQHLLGHASILTTQVYTHVVDVEYKRILSALHPRRRFRAHEEQSKEAPFRNILVPLE